MQFARQILALTLPDHEFVVSTIRDMVDIGCREQIVGNISVDVGVVVAPLHRSRDAVDLTDELLGERDV